MSLSIVQSNEKYSTELEDSFKFLAQKVCMMFATEGLHRKPYLEGLPYFRQLTDEKKQEVIVTLNFLSDMCEQQIAEGYRLRDNSSFTWRAFRKLGLTPSSDIFNFMTEDDLVEIYSKDNKQLYCNFRFFECCSYTLEELYSVEWFNLYERDQKITMKIFEAAAKVVSGEVYGSFVPAVDPHLLKEIRSEERLQYIQQVKVISPLKRNGSIEALLVVESVQPVVN